MSRICGEAGRSLWKRDRLARSSARWQQRQARAASWAYPGWLGRVYTSETAWRIAFVPLLGLALIVVGLVYLWRGVYSSPRWCGLATHGNVHALRRVRPRSRLGR